MIHKSTIFMTAKEDFAPGVCSICDKMRLLKFRDACCGFRICIECLGPLLFAHAFLSMPGLRPPTLEELRTRSVPND